MNVAAGERISARGGTGLFFVWMAGACALVAFIGFAPTYWAPLLRGAFTAKPVVHIHAVVFFGWVLFFLLQSILAASGRVRQHRALGLCGISLVTAMAMLAVLTELGTMHRAAAAGFVDRAKVFSVVPITDVLAFTGLITAAIANARRPEIHKRLMLVATISLLDAPVVRWVTLFMSPHGLPRPPSLSAALAAALISDVLILIACYHDWRSRGRVHPAYLLGGGGLLLVQLMRLPLGMSRVWEPIADALLQLA
jgi:hypothetical protein